MNTDSFYQIGKDHVTCEDYALSDIIVSDNLPYAIVCDGCSASPDVDFGARILAKAAEQTIFFHNNYNDINYELFSALTVQTASKIYNVFPTLHPQALDATLLVAWVDKGILTCYIYGDGVFIHKSQNATRLVHVDFVSGAPAYLSYNLDTKRKQNYMVEANFDKHVIDTIDGSFDYKRMKPFDPVVITAPVNSGDIISVCSDGINSFRHSNDDPIKWTELVEEFSGYKNFTGEFVNRRINAFKRRCKKENITFLDDISIASIVI